VPVKDNFFGGGGQGETLVPPTAVAGGDEGFVFEFEASDDNNNSGELRCALEVENLAPARAVCSQAIKTLRQ
jgi:hypothetical protein